MSTHRKADIEHAKVEAERFIRRCDEALTASSHYSYMEVPPKQSGALRRASMDLTRELAELRKYS